MKKTLIYVSGVAVLAVIWQIFSYAFTPEIVPFPKSVCAELFRMVSHGQVWRDLLLTVSRTIAGCFLAFAAGTAVGILTGGFLVFRRLLFIPAALLQGAPPLLWVIPMVLILGSGGLAPCAVVFFVTLPLVIINIQEGMKAIPHSKWEMFRIYAPSRFLILSELIVPSLRPSLKSALVLSVILGLKSSVLGEWFGAQDGIGRRINELFYSFNMVSFYAYSLLFLIIVTAFAFALERLGEKLFAERRKSEINYNYSAGMMENPASHPGSLEISGLSFSYGHRSVLSSSSLSIGYGETAVVTGISGAGKTTLAKIASGLLRPDHGKIILPKRPGFLFQDDALLSHLDCVGNAALPMRLNGNPDLPRVMRYLEMCGLGDHLYNYPDELSGGLKKRLSFARALVLDPDFMILDEPFNNLDREARNNLWDLYFTLFAERGIPALIVTHYPEELSSRKFTLYEISGGTVIKKQTAV